LLGSRCRADVIRILEFNCSNELAKMASNLGSVFRHDALLYCDVLGQASESAPSSVLFFDHRLLLQKLRSQRAVCLSWLRSFPTG